MLGPRWRKSPLVLLHHGSVLVAVFVAALLSAFASSSSPFVTTAIASESLRNKLAELTPFATGLEIRSSSVVGDHVSATALLRRADLFDDSARRLATGLRLRQPVVTAETAPLYLLGRGGASDVRLMARTRAIEHVRVLAKTSGPGVWVADVTAHAAGVKPGDELRLGQATFGRSRSVLMRVRGIYRALAYTPSSDYWANRYQEIYPQCPDCDLPPPYVFMSRAQIYRTLASLRNQRGGAASAGDGTRVFTRFAEMPVAPTGMTLGAARALDRKIRATRISLRRSSLGAALGCSDRRLRRPCSVTSSLSAAVALADRDAAAVTPAVSLLAGLGTGIALAIAAAAGIFLVRRRRAEAAFLYARGEHVGVFAARSAVESLLPTLAGMAAGFLLAYGLIGVFAPPGSIAAGTAASSAVHAAIAVWLGLALLVGCAALSFIRLFDTGGLRPAWLRWMLWELVLIVAAAVLYVRIRSGGSVTTGASHVPTLAVFVFPLLLVAGFAGLAARAGRLLLRRTDRLALAASPAPYLALRRLAASRNLLVVLAIVSATSLGAFFYVDALASSLDRSTVAKAYLATGSDAWAIVDESQRLPRSFPYPISRVQFANQSVSTADGTQIDVMLVDPATITRTLHWQADWGPNPARSLDQLARAGTQPLPLIVTPELVGKRVIVIGDRRVRVRTLASIRAFPFMVRGTPLAITSYRAFGAFEKRADLPDALGVLGTYVWGKGPPARVARALTGLSPAYPPSTIDSYLRAPNVVLASRTFNFMRMIAIGAGALALLALLLYLQARQRAQTIGSALARRMGLGAGTEALSLSLELGGVLAFAALIGGVVALAAAAPVVRRIDPLPGNPPPPIFVVPIRDIALAAIALVALAAVAGATTSLLARRGDVSEALRGA